MAQRIALITGITGQDGSYLAELLLSKSYTVYGMLRRSSQFNTSRIEHILSRLTLKYGDVLDVSNIVSILNEIVLNTTSQNIIEIYHLAAQSHVMVSFEVPVYTGNCDAIGTLHLLEAIRMARIQDRVRVYNATTSEMFGRVQGIPQTETTPFYPRSPYGVAKLYSFWIAKNYRESYKMHVCNGILFNHTSPRRGPTFVERKITMAVARIKHQFDANVKVIPLVLGNLEAQRDIGHARDYVYGMWLMLQSDTPDDYVLATGKTYSVRTLVEKCFQIAGISLVWDKSDQTTGLDAVTNTVIVSTDQKYFRPAEVDLLVGDPSKIVDTLGWNCSYTDIDDILTEMVEYDLFATR
jgi:GDPmannose 4,6-dehydratase